MTSTPKPPPVVERATLEDLDRIATIHLDAFNDPYFQSLFPPNGPGRKYHVKSFENFIRSKEIGIQEAQVWVIRDENGVVQSMALLWVANSEDGGAWDWARRYPPVVEGMDEPLLREFFKGMDSQHHGVMGPKEHIYFELLITHSSARKRGHASALLDHGSKIADELDYPLYLDADKAAVALYERKGYKAVKEGQLSELMMPMVRPRKSERGESNGI